MWEPGSEPLRRPSDGFGPWQPRRTGADSDHNCSTFIAHFHDATRGNGEDILLSFPLPTLVVGQQLTGLGIVHTLGTDSTVFTIQDYTAMSEVRAWGATFRE